MRYAAIESPYHDGFHLLDHHGSLTHIAQYFAPPIVSRLPITEHPGSVGGRFWAARFGSCLPGVIATGVLTQNYGPLIFLDGDVLDEGVSRRNERSDDEIHVRPSVGNPRF